MEDDDSSKFTFHECELCDECRVCHICELREDCKNCDVAADGFLDHADDIFANDLPRTVLVCILSIVLAAIINLIT